MNIKIRLNIKLVVIFYSNVVYYFYFAINII